MRCLRIPATSGQRDLVLEVCQSFRWNGLCRKSEEPVTDWQNAIQDDVGAELPSPNHRHADFRDTRM